MVDSTLYSWTTDQILRAYDTADNELLWQRFEPNSTSAIDCEGSYIIAKIDSKVIKVLSSASDAKVWRVVDAYIRKGNSLYTMNRINEAFASVKRAISTKPADLQANLVYARMHMKQGHFNESLEYYAYVMRFASKNSEEWNEAHSALSSTMGLEHILPYSTTRRIAVDGNYLFFDYRQNGSTDIARYCFENGEVEFDYVKDTSFWLKENGELFYSRGQGIFSKNINSGENHTIIAKVDEFAPFIMADMFGPDHTFMMSKGVVVVPEVVDGERRLSGYSSTSGALLWQNRYSGELSLASTENYLICVAYTDLYSRYCKTFCLDPLTGKLIWSKRIPFDHREYKLMMPAHSGIIAFEYDGFLHLHYVYRSIDGDTWKSPEHTIFASSPEFMGEGWFW